MEAKVEFIQAIAKKISDAKKIGIEKSDGRNLRDGYTITTPSTSYQIPINSNTQAIAHVSF